jgi:radical SAM superfamily enzyme
MFGEAPFGLLVAPNWNRDKNDLVQDIHRKFAERNVVQGKTQARRQRL